MPGPFTHIYEARRVADFLAAHGDFVRADDDGAVDRAALASPERAAEFARVMQRWPKFTSLGAIGPDLFFFMLDLHKPFDDALMLAMRAGYEADDFNRELDELDRTKRDHWNNVIDVFNSGGDPLNAQAGKLIDAYTTLMPVWRKFSKIWEELLGSVGALAREDVDLLTGKMFSAVAEALTYIVKAYVAKELREELSETDFFAFFSLGMQKGVDEKDFFWSDMLHYRRTSEMAAALFRRATAYSGEPEHKEQLLAYALGYACHVATDVTGHPFVNEQCGGPFRTHWQRHHMVENHIDAWNYRETKPGGSLPRDSYCGAIDGYPELAQSALYFAVQLTDEDPDGELRRPLPPSDPNIAPAPGDAKGLSPLQRRVRDEALDTDGEFPEWLAAELVHALFETYGADANATPPAAPRGLKGFDFQTDTVEPIFHDDYARYGLNRDNVPPGFPLPWEVQVSYRFMLSYFKRGFMDGFDLPRPQRPTLELKVTPGSSVSTEQLQTSFDEARSTLQELIDALEANKNRLRDDLGLGNDDFVNELETALDFAMNKLLDAMQAISEIPGINDGPVALVLEAIGNVTLPLRIALYETVTEPRWKDLRDVRADLTQRGFLMPQDAEFLPDGTMLHDMEIDRKHVQLGYDGSPVAPTTDTGWEALFVASQVDAAGTWGESWSAIDSASARGRCFTVVRDDGGTLQAFTIATDSNVSNASQHGPNGTWSGWNGIGLPLGLFGREAVDLAVASRASGGPEVFTVGQAYEIYHSWPAPGGWTPFVQIGDGTGIAVAAGRGAGNRLAAFALGIDNDVSWSVQVGGDWSAWMKIDDTAKLLDRNHRVIVRIVVERDGDGLLRLVAVDNAGGVVYAQQAPDASMGPWQLFGAAPPPPVCSARGAVACAVGGDGMFNVAACGMNGELFVAAQRAADDPSGASWERVAAPVSVHAVALASNADGSLEAVVVAADSTVWAARRAGTAWSVWQPMRGAPKARAVHLVPNADGRLQAFVEGVPDSSEHRFVVNPPLNSGAAAARNPQSASYPYLPLDDEFTNPGAYPIRTRDGGTNGVESVPTVAGPFPQDTLAHALLATDGPADNDARRRYEQAKTPHETDSLNEQYVGHGDPARRWTNPLGAPVLFSAYLIGRLNATGANVANFNLDADRGYGYLCWDWVRDATKPADGYNDSFASPQIWPRVQPDSKIVLGMDSVWRNAASEWQRQGGDLPLLLRYVPGDAEVPPNANDRAVPAGEIMIVRVEPPGIPVGQPVSVTISATDSADGRAITGFVLIDGHRAGRLGMPFSYTFAGTENAVAGAYGYADTAVPLSYNRLAVSVDPMPTPLGEPVRLFVMANDARNGNVVSGTVALDNFDGDGNDIAVEFPAFVATDVVLRKSKGSRAKGAQEAPEYPSAAVSAPGYPGAVVPFRWREHPVPPRSAPPPAAPPKRMTLTVSPQKLPLGKPVSVTVQAVDAATGEAIAGTVVVAGNAAGSTGVPFAYTFAGAPEAHVSAPGFADAPVPWGEFFTPSMNVVVEPSPLVFGTPIQLLVRAGEAHTGEPVPATVELVNYDVRGMPRHLTFPANAPFDVTLRSRVTPARRGNPSDVVAPTLRVRADGFATVETTLFDPDGV